MTDPYWESFGKELASKKKVNPGECACVGCGQQFSVSDRPGKLKPIACGACLTTVARQFRGQNRSSDQKASTDKEDNPWQHNAIRNLEGE